MSENDHFEPSPGYAYAVGRLPGHDHRRGPRRGALAADQRGGEPESWYLYRIGGKDVGHIHEAIRRDGDQVSTTVETLIVINRLGSKVEIKGKAVFTESAEGRLRRPFGDVQLAAGDHPGRDRGEGRGPAGGLHGRQGIPARPRRLRRHAGSLGHPAEDDRRPREGGRHHDRPDARAGAGADRPGDPQAPRAGGYRLPALGTTAAYLRVEERLEGFPRCDPSGSTDGAAWSDRRNQAIRRDRGHPDRSSDRPAAGGESLPEEMFDRTLVHIQDSGCPARTR